MSKFAADLTWTETVVALAINIKLYGECKKHAPGDQTDFTLRLEPGATLSDVLHQLSIPQDSYVSLVNGRRAAQNVTLTEGDTLVVFPPVSGG